jgi:hypothetical protein
MSPRSLALLALAVLCGCDSASPTDAGGDDAGRADAGRTDAGRRVDAGRSEQDAGGGADAGLDAASDAGTDAGGDGGTVCTSELDALTDGLFFTSEGDYPIEIERFDGEGTDAPTADDVLRLSEAPLEATTMLRDVDYFFARVVIDPTRKPPVDPALPEMLRDAVEAELTDLIVVRVTDPAEPVLIGVYLVGRDACGALVWLGSTAVET